MRRGKEWRGRRKGEGVVVLPIRCAGESRVTLLHTDPKSTTEPPGDTYKDTQTRHDM